MSGSTIGAIAGAAIGSMFGMPQLGWMIGSAVGGYVDPERYYGPRLEDAQAQTSREGIPIPFGYGTFNTAGNVIWSDVLVEHEDEQQAGKGGAEQVTYRYTRSYAVGICEGPIDGVVQVKRNGKVVYDARPDAEIEDQYADGVSFAELLMRLRAQSDVFSNRATFYLGTEDQLPDPIIEAVEGVGNVPPMKGLVYMVVENDDVTDSAGAIPQYEFVVAKSGAASTFIDTLGPAYPGFTNEDWPLVHADSLYPAAGVRNENPADAIAGDTIAEILAANPTTQYYMGWRCKADSGATPMSLDGDQADPTDNFSVQLYYTARAWDVDGLPAAESMTPGVYYRDNATSYAATVHVKTGDSTPPAGFTNYGTDGAYYLHRCLATIITVYRAEVSPQTGATPIPDSPNLYLYEDGAVRLARLWSNVTTGTYKGLTHYSLTGPAEHVVYDQYTRGPVLRSDHADYASESFWTDAYETAKGLGQVPAGWVYGVDYPVVLHPDPDAHGTPARQEVWTGTAGELIDRDTVPLSEIVADLCERAGLTADDYDVSQLTDEVQGYKVATEGGADVMLEPLRGAFFFDVAEWDGKLRFVKRGGAPTFALTHDDLVAQEGDAFQQTRVQEAELLRKVNVISLDPAAGWQPTKQTAERRTSTVQAVGEATVEVPVVLTTDEAAQVADKRLKVAWAETEKYTFALTSAWAKLTPTDVGTFTDKAGKVHTLRLVESGEEGGVIQWTATKTRAATYTSAVTGIAPNPPPLTTPGLFGSTTLAVMNLPAWREEDDGLGVYMAARGTIDGFASLLSAWFGARVYLSGDGGASYRAVANLPALSTIGHVTSAVTAWHTSETPSTPSTLTVSLPRAPSSLSYAAMLRYGNRAALQLDDGTWEIVQYQTVTAGANNTYTLEGVVRGRYATTPGTASAGNTFVLLDNTVKFVPIEQWVVGADDLMVKAVSYGTSADAVTGQAIALETAAAQTEWAPSFVQASRDGSDNVTVTWVGRGRIGTETAPRHSQYCTGYRITYSDGATYDVGPTVTTHTRASTPASQTITVCGLNAFTGEGTHSTGVTA